MPWVWATKLLEFAAYGSLALGLNSKESTEDSSPSLPAVTASSEHMPSNRFCQNEEKTLEVHMWMGWRDGTVLQSVYCSEVLGSIPSSPQ